MRMYLAFWWNTTTATRRYHRDRKAVCTRLPNSFSTISANPPLTVSLTRYLPCRMCRCSFVTIRFSRNWILKSQSVQSSPIHLTLTRTMNWRAWTAVLSANPCRRLTICRKSSTTTTKCSVRISPSRISVLTTMMSICGWKRRKPTWNRSTFVWSWVCSSRASIPRSWTRCMWIRIWNTTDCCKRSHVPTVYSTSANVLVRLSVSATSRAMWTNP